MVDGHNIARGVSTVQAGHVAWDRARALSLVSRRHPVLAGSIAPWLWLMAVVAASKGLDPSAGLGRRRRAAALPPFGEGNVHVCENR